ncbi:MAG: DUF1223 domain-containing protein [Terracidiphilus sp.]|jgi:hypothetical protein
MRIILASLIMFCIARAALSQSADASGSNTPVLVELFTSEGCSSCPPADAWLKHIDESQPIPGAQLIVLSEHVDYWDHDGWKDPYSSAVFTDRQSAYVRALGIASPYTPQVIVDGKSELQLNDPQKIGQVLRNAAKAPRVSVNISAVKVEGTAPALLRAQIDVDGTAEKHDADIYAAVALDHAQSQVLHGENGGRQLNHVAVIEQLIKIGKMQRGKSFSMDLHTKLKPEMVPGNLRLVVFVQEQGLGNVIGAALQQIKTPGK